MRHCFLMTLYKPESVPIVNRFISHLPDDWGIYIHIDKKSKISPIDIDKRAHIKSLYKVYWGGKEHLDALVSLMREAYYSSSGYDYYHTVSGECYWCCRPEDFDQKCVSPHSFILAHPLPREGWFNGGYELLQYKQLASFGDIRKGLFFFLNRVVKWTQILFGIKQHLPDYPLYSGIPYGPFHHSAIREILQNPIAEDLNIRMKNTLNSEELFFATVLMNSPIKDNIIKKQYRYVDWSSNPAPKYLGIDDLTAVLSSGNILCRKVADLNVAIEIDARLGLS